MNIQKMLKQAQKMQQQFAERQAALAEETHEASVGGGKVTVVATGEGEIVSIKISPDVVDPSDVEMLEDLVLTGVNQAIQLGRQRQHEELGKLTGGFSLPSALGL